MRAVYLRFKSKVQFDITLGAIEIISTENSTLTFIFVLLFAV